MAAEDYLPWGEGWYPGEMEETRTPSKTKTTKKTTKEKKQMSNEIPTPAPAKPGKETPAFAFGSIGEQKSVKRGQIVILYGEGGTGKTTLACMLPGKVAFLDLEKSLDLLKPSFDELGIGSNVSPLTADIPDFKTLCDALNAPIYDGFDSIVIDSLSTVQEMAKTYTYAHSPTKAKTRATCLDDYEFSTGPMYVFRWMIPNFWNAVEKHARAGRNVLIIAHEVYETIPTGDGAEYKQYQFDALFMKSGKDSIRHFMNNNADHVLMLKANITADKKKNAVGGDDKTLYAAPLPYIMAKSRTKHEPTYNIVPGEVFDWSQIIK